MTPINKYYERIHLKAKDHKRCQGLRGILALWNNIRPICALAAVCILLVLHPACLIVFINCVPIYPCHNDVIHFVASFTSKRLTRSHLLLNWTKFLLLETTYWCYYRSTWLSCSLLCLYIWLSTEVVFLLPSNIYHHK